MDHGAVSPTWDEGRRILSSNSEHGCIVQSGIAEATHNQTKSGIPIKNYYTLYDSGFCHEVTTYSKEGCQWKRDVEGTLVNDGLMCFLFSAQSYEVSYEVKVIFVVLGRLIDFHCENLKDLTRIHYKKELMCGCPIWSKMNIGSVDRSPHIRLVCNIGVYAGKVIKQWNNGVVTQLNRELMLKRVKSGCRYKYIFDDSDDDDEDVSDSEVSFSWSYPKGNESDEDGSTYGSESDSDVLDNNSEVSFSWSYPKGNESDEDGSSYGSESDSDVLDNNNTEIRVEDVQNLSFPWYFPKRHESDEDGFSYGRKSDSDVSDDNNIESVCKHETDHA